MPDSSRKRDTAEVPMAGRTRFAKEQCGLCPMFIAPWNMRRHIDVHLRAMESDDYRHLTPDAHAWLYAKGYRV